VRDGRVALRTVEQQHVFNMPYQLGSQSSDRPHHGDRYELTLRPGDTVLLASDGVWDNLSDARILAALTAARAGRGEAQREARAVAEAAYAVSVDESVRDTPFNVHAQQQLRQTWRGGKPDDITVLVLHYDALARL